MDGAAEVLVIILSVFLGIFLVLAIILTTLLIKVTIQMKAIAKSAQRTAEDIETTVSNISRATSKMALIGVAKALFNMITKNKRR